MRLSYAIENIRRIVTLPEIELRPITILVGRNSAGKSTFLRTLPLLRQSLETRSSAPILWFGDLVDFGDITTAIGGTNSSRRAAFRFTIHDLNELSRPHFFFQDAFYPNRDTVNVDLVSLRYEIGNRDEKTILQRIEVAIPNEDIDVSFNFGTRQDSFGAITINNLPASFFQKPYGIRTPDRNLFNPPLLIARTSDKSVHARSFFHPRPVLATALIETFRQQVSRPLSEETIRREALHVLSQNRFDERTIGEMIQSASTVTFSNIYRHLSSRNSSDFKNQVFAIQRLARVYNILEILEQKLTNYFLNVTYLEPVRAASERFYRKQELEVSEIAPDGSNFAMFLASLTLRELERFSEWVESIFGYGVRIRRTGGHISIELFTAQGSVNVTDTGYGVSQILPVLGMIWWARHPKPRLGPSRRRAAGLKTLAIEQPELHLHPAHQAKLADVFVSAIAFGGDGDQSSEVRLLIETHSEALINRLGELVEEGRIGPDSIQIVIFSARDDLKSPTEVSLSSFDKHGALLDWPYGFFRYSNK